MVHMDERMTVYVKVETATHRTILSFDDEKVDHGFAILRLLDERHPGERDAERDMRWLELARAA